MSAPGLPLVRTDSCGDSCGCGEAGVDYLSVGALTHSSPVLDISLDLRCS